MLDTRPIFPLRTAQWEVLANWWGRDAGPVSRRLLLLLIVLVSLSVALLGVPRQHIYGHDIFIALDGAWRVLHGQRPGVDFFAQMGPSYFLLHAAGLALAGQAARGLAYGNALATALMGLWAFLLLRGRMKRGPFVVACLFLTFLAAAPFPLGHSPWRESFSMKHNRYGFALTGLALLECFLPDDSGDPRKAFRGGFSTGLACAAALFMKISYGMVGLALVAASLLIRPASRARAVGIASGFTVLTLPMLAYLRFDLPALFAEYRMLAAARGRDAGLTAVLRVLYHDRFEMAPLWLLALMVSLLPGIPIRRALTLLAVVAMATLAGAALMSTNTAQYYGAPLADVSALLLLNELASASWLTGRSLAAPLIALGLLVTSIPISLDAAGVALAIKDKFASSSEPGYRLSPPHLADLEFVSCEEIEFGFPCAPNDNGANFVQFTEEGLTLLRGHSGPGETVRGLGMSNPFSYAALRLPPKGGSVTIGYTNVREGSVPPEDRLIGNVDVLLLPKFQASERSTLQVVLRQYPDLLGRRFVQVAESPNWILYRRAL